MRETLERTVGRKIEVPAILLTHWHYADGTAAWLDEGTEIWGHEHLDRNRTASGGVSVLGGYLMSRATAQFGVFHPTTGPDAFPNALSFTPEKFLLVSSYQPPTRLFADGEVIDVVIAGEPIQVAPMRTDTTDSVAFYFPQRGGAFRSPEILLDIHGPTLRGARWCGRRWSAQSTRCSSSMTRRCACSRAAWAPARRQSRSTCRATCASTVKATGRSRVTSGRSTMGTSAGSTTTSTRSTRSPSKKRPSGWWRRWAAARQARALGQRTDSANARGFYITEALQLEGNLLVQGQPQTMDGLRTFLSTPRLDRLAAVSVDQNLQFVRYLVDPRKAEGRRRSARRAGSRARPQPADAADDDQAGGARRQGRPRIQPRPGAPAAAVASRFVRAPWLRRGGMD